MNSRKLFTQSEVRKIVDDAVATATAQLLKRIKELELRIARLTKNSSNSSKPPSSDIVKPQKAQKKGEKKRKKGAQKGHKRHERRAFTPDEIDRYECYELDLDPRTWEPLDEWDTLQQVELKTSPLEITEHRSMWYRNKLTGEFVAARFPKELVAAGLVGPKLSALTAYLKGAGHMSYSTISTLFSDVFRVDISRGLLAKIVTEKVSGALAVPYEDIKGRLPDEGQLGIDETGHKDDGKRHWTWCFRADEFTLFHIADTRSTQVLFDLLGEAFAGVITCDYFAAYRKFLGSSSATMQFCLAHLIRDVKFLLEGHDKVVRNWAKKTLDEFVQLFKLIHKRDQLTSEIFERRLIRFRSKLKKRFNSAPNRDGARALRKRFKDFPSEFFTFMTTPGIEPTNNLTEQAIRYVVIDRKITQGTRGTKGQRWCERIWTTISTCHMQGRSVFEFLTQAIQSHFCGGTPPSLLPPDP